MSCEVTGHGVGITLEPMFKQGAVKIMLKRTYILRPVRDDRETHQSPFVNQSMPVNIIKEIKRS
jgi:hypothetical protein